VVDAEAGEIGREEVYWICELYPPPPLPQPGAVHSCDDLFVEVARNIHSKTSGEIRDAERMRRPAKE
jgi:hypothetical protein